MHLCNKDCCCDIRKQNMEYQHDQMLVDILRHVQGIVAVVDRNASIVKEVFETNKRMKEHIDHLENIVKVNSFSWEVKCPSNEDLKKDHENARKAEKYKEEIQKNLLNYPKNMFGRFSKYSELEDIEDANEFINKYKKNKEKDQ